MNHYEFKLQPWGNPHWGYCVVLMSISDDPLSLWEDYRIEPLTRWSVAIDTFPDEVESEIKAAGGVTFLNPMKIAVFQDYLKGRKFLEEYLTPKLLMRVMNGELE